jgi:hypothetical protein
LPQEQASARYGDYEEFDNEHTTAQELEEMQLMVVAGGIMEES